MKKILLLVVAMATTGLLWAQSDCMQFFPNNEGAVLINTTYDAQNNVLGTMTYRIDKVYDYSSGTNMQINFNMADRNGNSVDNGYLDANCMDGVFSMKMVNRGLTSDIMNAMSMDTELVGDFLDYPNVFSSVDYPFESPFEMNGGEFTIQSKKDKNNWVKVRVYNRQYVGNDNVTTPARTESFSAAKVTFDFEVTKDKKTTRYKGAEWYAVNAGIIKAETYDSNNMLLTRTLLTTLRGN